MILSRKIPLFLKGRFRGLERNKRFCNLCSDNCLGDEYHVLFECKNISIIESRKKCLPRLFVNHLSMFKLALLLQSEKPRMIYVS